MKKIVALLLCIVLFATAFAGCSSQKTETQKYKDLKIGLMPFAGSVPASYAKEQGWFDEADLNVKFEIFPTGAPMNEAFSANKIDVAVIGLAGVFAMASGNSTCVLETNKTSGGNGVFVNKDSEIAKEKGNVQDKPNILGSAETIKGKTFLTQLGTGSQRMVTSYLNLFGLTEQDVNLVHVETGQDYQALIAGQADAAALMVPFSYEAMQNDMVCLALDEEIDSFMIPDVILVRNDVLENRRDEIVLFVREYLKAADVLESDIELRYDFSNTYYKSAGLEYTDDSLNNDIELRTFVTKNYMSTTENFKFGEGMYNVGKFFADIGKIEKENLPNVLKSLDVSIIKDAIGYDAPVFSGE